MRRTSFKNRPIIISDDFRGNTTFDAKAFQNNITYKSDVEVFETSTNDFNPDAWKSDKDGT